MVSVKPATRHSNSKGAGRGNRQHQRNATSRFTNGLVEGAPFHTSVRAEDLWVTFRPRSQFANGKIPRATRSSTRTSGGSLLADEGVCLRQHRQSRTPDPELIHDMPNN